MARITEISEVVRLRANANIEHIFPGHIKLPGKKADRELALIYFEQMMNFRSDYQDYEVSKIAQLSLSRVLLDVETKLLLKEGSIIERELSTGVIAHSKNPRLDAVQLLQNLVNGVEAKLGLVTVQSLKVSTQRKANYQHETRKEVNSSLLA